MLSYTMLFTYMLNTNKKARTLYGKYRQKNHVLEKKN